MINKMSNTDIDWPNVDADLDHIESIERRKTITDFVRGVAAMLFSSVMGTFFALLIVMTGDPNEEITLQIGCCHTHCTLCNFSLWFKKID